MSTEAVLAFAAFLLRICPGRIDIGMFPSDYTPSNQKDAREGWVLYNHIEFEYVDES